jgi:oxygen-independent coproporphyrinogen-3 oxidase
MSLYIHYPFCRRRCSFCGCNAIATNNRSIIDRYVGALVDEIKMVSEEVSRECTAAEVTAIHFGGGSPDYMPEAARRWILDELNSNFCVSENAQFSIELDPMRVEPRDVMRFRAEGFNRMSFGVQDCDEKVLSSIGRRADPKRLCELIDVAEEIGFRGTAVDLMYGLPFQSWKNFEGTINELASIKPDRIALFNFAYLPKMLPHQKTLPVEAMPKQMEKMELLARSAERLTGSGYIFLGLDHFVRRDDSLERALKARTLSRGFQGYEAGPENVLVGLGCSSIGRVGDWFFQNEHNLKRYMDAIDAGRFAIVRGHRMTQEDRMRRWIINELMCYREAWNDELSRRWNTSLGEACGERVSLAEQMVDDGLLETSDVRWIVTPKGRLFLRNIAQLFDRHSGGDSFSRSV